MYNDIEENLRNSKKPNPVSGHLFQENFIRGLKANGADIEVINVPRIRHYPDYPRVIMKPSVYLLDGCVIGNNIGFLNIFLISYISQYFNLKKALYMRLDQLVGAECTLLVFNSYLIQTLVILGAKNRYKNIKTCDIIGDLHGNYGVLRKYATIKERLVDLYGRIEDKFAKCFEYYVFLSKFMVDVLQCEKSQYVVVEGIYNEKRKLDNNSIVNNKNVVYAGSLNVEYDIEHLLKAFVLTIDKTSTLFIAGNGNGLEIVHYYVNKDKRIKYLGVLSPEELLKYQLNATALINPRKNNHRYVKYSFPSKTMECLAIGKPYIAHKLDSIPEEYSDYIQYCGESDEDLAKRIDQVLSMSDIERSEIGKKSRKFILEKKNPATMTKKLLQLIEN